jgi:hypothetical protein
VLDASRRTLLMLAASTGNLEVMKELLNNDVSIKAVDAYGKRAMQYVSAKHLYCRWTRTRPAVIMSSSHVTFF